MFRVVGLFLFALLLSACSQVQLEHQSDSFNRASASTMSEHTLLNAVRSSLDLPLSFTKLQKFTANSMGGSTLGSKFPFGAQAPLLYDLTPGFNLSAGVSTIEYVDVNNGSALAKLNEDITFGTFERYMSQGIDPRLLNTILVEYVEIDGDFMKILMDHARRKCAAPSSYDKLPCEKLHGIAAACRETSLLTSDGGQLNFPGRRSVYHIGNRAQTKCEYLAFQTVESLMGLAGYFADLGSVSVKEIVKNEEGKKIAVDKEKPVPVIWFEDPVVNGAYQKLDAPFRAESKIKNKGSARTRVRPVIRYSFRSPKSLLTYLGELIALQSRDRSFHPTILQQDNKPLTFFRIVRGSSPDGAALFVRGPDGQGYFVPKPEYGSELRDQTLRVLAIASEVVNEAISEKDFPAPASIVVRPIQ